MHWRDRTERTDMLGTASAGLVIVIFLTQLVLFSSTDIVLIRQGVAYLYDDWRPALDILCAVMLIAEYVFILLRVFSERAQWMPAKLLCAFLTWLVVTRVLCGDPTLVESVEYVRVAALCVALFCFSMMLGKKERRLMMNALAAIICAYYFVIAVLSVVVAVTRENIQLPLGIGIAIKSLGYSFVTVVGRSKNTASMWYVVSLCLAAYLFSLTKNKPLRVLCVIASLAFYAAVSVSRSRVTMLALSLAMSMLVMLPVLNKLNGRKTAVKAAAVLLIALIIVPLSYKSYGVVSAALSNANVVVQHESEISDDTADASDNTPETEAEVQPQEEDTPAAEDTAVQEDIFKETRGEADVKILGGRVRLWKSVYTTLYFERERLLYGSLTNSYMYMINMFSKFPDPQNGEVNTHNFLVEALVLTGIPGFLLLLCFTLILVIRMIRIFFYEGADVQMKLLIVLLAATLFKNMGEAMLIRTDDITNYLFFFAAGVFLAYSYELFPEKALPVKLPGKNNGK